MRTNGAMSISSLRRAALGLAGVGALVVTAACGTKADSSVRALGYEGGFAQPVAQQVAGAANGQVLVNCEPNQRTLVRQAVVSGQPVAQVQCVSAEVPYAAAPVAYGNGALAVRDYGYDTRVVQPAVVQQPAVVYREARPRTVSQRGVVTERSSGRSVKKSAIIIGSSAGVGAGVGAAVGGKKGALIGAAIGGGSAAIWDQITRRN
ncbi:MAG: hypothetical protein HYU53_11950 [Acidobacteria bacterium]|nr:hypothetical protein [Acidobacteriota bacterium]